MPFSGVSKSGGGSIIHAGGSGGVTFAGCVELQPTLASSNIVLKLIDSFLSIGKFLCVFGIQCSNITLPCCHVGDGGISNIQRLSFLIALLLIFGGIVTIVIYSPAKRHDDADDNSNDDCG
ncbi:hypothetical protein LB103_13625 [Klebsiella aerogenes]|nr:hypothetical protein [Klebsiella aerogenes]